MKDYSKLPADLAGSLERYLEQKIEPGGFLTAVLENDLKEAIAWADHINIHRIVDIVKWLYNEAPYPSWGSKERVKAWLDRGAK